MSTRKPTNADTETGTITITFCDQGENHVGMQKLGEKAESGYSHETLVALKEIFESKKCKCQIINLKTLLKGLPEQKSAENAYVLVIKSAVDALLFESNADDLLAEQKSLEWDQKAFMYGRVVNKNARYNLCYGDISQEPDYENKKGRIIAFDEVPLLSELKNNLTELLSDIDEQVLVAEGNYYYDINNCGIGYHGDAERRKVIGVRLGQTVPLVFRWYHRNERIGAACEINLDHGDIYFMSDKAVGSDWKSSSFLTLRHAAGCQKFIK
jgi:alkylated DNA repair dioxygenase AlkB